MKFTKTILYDIMCVFFAIINAGLFALVILFSAGIIKGAGGIVATALLTVGGILTALYLILHRVKGALFKKIGFYLTHVGLVLLLVGFAVFELWGNSISLAFPINSESFYSRVQRENGEIYELGFNMRVDSFETELYEDGSPKQYYAELAFADSITLKIDKMSLSVNHPIYRGGKKIYLMGESDGTVNLLIREDPGEYSVKAGAVLVIGGCICSLIAGNIKRKEHENE